MRNTPQAWDVRAQLATSWEAALWSEEGQRARFEAILRHLPFQEGDTVLDYGCGTGALCDYLPANVSYVGWDWSPRMRERARAEHPSGSFLQGPPHDKRYEHIVCCGTFNLAADWTHEQTWSIVRSLWRRSTGVSLSVSLYRGTDSYCLHYGLDEVADFVWREGIRRFIVDTSYKDNDLLLCCLK